MFVFCFSSRRQHTVCALVTGVHTCALPISGGDEFAVVLPHSTLDDAERIGDSLLRTIAAVRFEHEARSYKLSASIGISVINSETLDANTVLAEADTACYEIGRAHV